MHIIGQTECDVGYDPPLIEEHIYVPASISNEERPSSISMLDVTHACLLDYLHMTPVMVVGVKKCHDETLPVYTPGKQQSLTHQLWIVNQCHSLHENEQCHCVWLVKVQDIRC